MIALWMAACADQRPPKLLAINDADYQYDALGSLGGYAGINVEPGERVVLRVEALHTVEIRFTNMPGMVEFDPFGTVGAIEVFDAEPDTGSWSPESLVTLWNDAGASRDFPVMLVFPREPTDSPTSTDYPYEGTTSSSSSSSSSSTSTSSSSSDSGT